MKTRMNDEEVIRQYDSENPNECFETLYNRYAQKVYSRCYSITRDSEKARDFTHDIFIKMFAHLDRFQERSTFSTWLYSISYNYCMDQIKKAGRLSATGLEENCDYANASTDDGDGREETLQRLASVMETLAPQEAQILRMKYQDGLDVVQIASQLNLTESAVKMRLKRSRDRVRQRCEESFHQYV